MPIHEADPWRLQYFEGVSCPADVKISTEDCDGWAWNPRHRWVYDKIAVAQSQGLQAAPHGVEPAAVALAWLLAKPGVVPLAGAKTGEQAARNARALAVALSAAELAELDAATDPWRVAG